MNKAILKLLTITAVVFTFIGSVFSSAQPLTIFTANCAEIHGNDTLLEYAHQVADIVNQERTAQGLTPLKYSEKLCKAADIRAKEIQTYFSHTRPDGTSCFTAVTEMGIRYRYIGENIAYGQRTPEEVMNAWMKSDGHRANILNTGFDYIGIGVTERNGVYYWSQFFAASDDLEKADIQTTLIKTTQTQTTSTTAVTSVSTVRTNVTECRQCNYNSRLEWLRQVLKRYRIELNDILTQPRITD